MASLGTLDTVRPPSVAFRRRLFGRDLKPGEGRPRRRNMYTFLYSDPVCLDHDPGPGHPENAERLRAIIGALEWPTFWALERCEAPKAELEDLYRVHKQHYVDFVLSHVPDEGYFKFDGDTALSPASGEAALRSAGAACDAVDAVFTGQARNAFCATRPPGHHAEPSRAMGFCFFNNVAVAAYRARAVHGVEKVAVVDFDVHHGNGTQSMFEEDPNMFYASTHQFPAFPGTGMEYETGVGNIVNVHLAPGSKSEVFRAAYEDNILPKLRAFNPDFLLISAGFDAHVSDPLAQIRLTVTDFDWITNILLDVADECCRGIVVSVLEGGYKPDIVSGCVSSHVRLMMEH